MRILLNTLLPSPSAAKLDTHRVNPKSIGFVKWVGEMIIAG